MTGLIVAQSYGTYSVEANGEIYKLTPRGSFRNKNLKPTVGDKVEFSLEDKTIEDISIRTSILKRPAIANIDQLFVVSSFVEPEFSYLLAFKYLTYANMNNIPVSLIITKCDRFFDEDKKTEIKNVFNSVGVDVYFVSNKKNIGLDEIRPLFKNKITCFMGQTGVGKSSLINAVDATFKRDVGEYSQALGRGKHKTKEVVLLPYMDGYIADTPGFSSLDLELFKEDIAQFFPGFKQLFVDCYFSNCLHISENRCAIKKAINEGEISSIAYDCYIKLSNESIFKKERFNK